MTALMPVGTRAVTAPELEPDLVAADRAAPQAARRSKRAGAARWRGLVIVCDVVSAGTVLDVLTRHSAHRPLHVALVTAAWLVALAATGAFDATRVPFWPDEVRRVWLASLGLAASLPLVAGMTGEPVDHAAGSTVAVVLLACGSTCLRWLLRVVAALRSGSRVGALRVVVAGHRREIDRMVAELGAARLTPYDVVDVCEVSTPDGDALARMAAATRRAAADALVVAPCRHLDPASLRRLSWQLEQSQARLLVSTSLLDVSSRRIGLTRAGGLPMVSIRQARMRGATRALKDLTERLLASVALLLLAPLLAVVMVMIRIDSAGPALFRQTRIGKDGVAFSMLKFRTMHQGAHAVRDSLQGQVSPESVLFKLRDDPRTTGVGRFLRRYSLDELPQLVNVVRGEMALVGPRPPLPEEVARYEPDVLRRLAVKPGITGLWQVSGRSDLSWDESVRIDLRYVDNWSWPHDWLIMLRTVGAVLSHRGAY